MRKTKSCGYYLLIVSNVIICLSFGFGVLAFYKLGKPFIRGFYCNDQSISKPFFGSTISSNNVLIFSGFVSLFAYLIVETWKIYDVSSFVILKRSKKKIIKNVVIMVGLFCFGSGLTMFITDIGKYTVGRLRPNFFALCKPDWAKINCTDGFGNYKYIVGDDFCTADDPRDIKDARLSFPSGHSSFSAFSATFLINYLQINLKFQNQALNFPKVLTQSAAAILGLYCALTRIMDNKHHPTDVGVGILLGVLIAFIVTVFLMKPMFHKTVITTNEDEEKAASLDAESHVISDYV